MSSNDKNLKPPEVPPSKNRDNIITNQETTVPPRFLIVKRKEGDFSTTNPFLIQKYLYGKVGQVKNVRKIRDGLLIETSSAAQSRQISQLKNLLEFEIEVTAHSTLNNAKGVINCRDLLNCTEQEILEELKEQGVIDVRRIKTKKDGKLVDTPIHILTFNVPKLPQQVKAAFYNLRVRQFIPSPLRCFKCQGFGHTSTRCVKEQICVCGKSLHMGNPCQPPVKCVNCKGDHSARSKDCPIYKQEVAIQEIKAKENISYTDAKKKVLVHTPKPNISYARAIAPPIVHSPTINTEELVKKLIPHLVSALSAFYIPPPQLPQPKMLPPPQLPQPTMLPPPQLPQPTMSPPSQKITVPDPNSPIQKRYRTDSSDSESITSKPGSSTKKPKPRKKPKRGWKKGRPRKKKDPDTDEDSSEIQETPSLSEAMDDHVDPKP
ncbi:unnamed protein product [Psylliodes chrysocephalus]|uniref:Gag-like protein n=1 Tax=Psylliodes chrysocephalus TaxID=3402493 RepID=A0A9P0CMD4_9CUCU|nr:unnamed protein product [Psylliodes chrysocephala]